jgi:hypothetical protein
MFISIFDTNKVFFYIFLFSIVRYWIIRDSMKYLREYDGNFIDYQTQRGNILRRKQHRRELKVLNNIRVDGFRGKIAEKDDIKCSKDWKRFSSVAIT